MAFKNILSVIPVSEGFAVAVDGQATGQFYPTKEKARAEMKKIREARQEKREAEKTAKK